MLQIARGRSTSAFPISTGWSSSGTPRYEFFFNDDESAAMVVEEYVDTNALMEHGAHLGQLSPEVRANLEGGPVQPFALFLSKDQPATSTEISGWCPVTSAVGGPSG